MRQRSYALSNQGNLHQGPGLALLAFLTVALSGCIYLVVGGIGAFGGYVVSPDTVEGITEKDSDIVWDAAVKTMSIMGVIEEQNEEGGIIFANVHAAKITVKVMSLSPTATKVSVKARKAYLPRISLAQDVFVKIMNQLNE
jgi:hypothetical protein